MQGVIILMLSKQTEKSCFLFPEELRDQEDNYEILFMEHFILKCG